MRNTATCLILIIFGSLAVLAAQGEPIIGIEALHAESMHIKMFGVDSYSGG